MCLGEIFRMKVLQLGIKVRVRQTCNIYQFMKYIHVHSTATYWACNVCMVQCAEAVQKKKKNSTAQELADTQAHQQMKQHHVSGARMKLHNAQCLPYPLPHATCLDLSPDMTGTWDMC